MKFEVRLISIFLPTSDNVIARRILHARDEREAREQAQRIFAEQVSGTSMTLKIEKKEG